MLKGKTVVIGVSGGIAVYKACDIVSRLKKLNANVQECNRICYTFDFSVFKSKLCGK